jgi:hypothetical protein
VPAGDGESIKIAASRPRWGHPLRDAGPARSFLAGLCDFPSTASSISTSMQGGMAVMALNNRDPHEFDMAAVV